MSYLIRQETSFRARLKPREADEAIWSILEDWQPWVLEGTYRLYSLGLTDS